MNNNFEKKKYDFLTAIINSIKTLGLFENPEELFKKTAKSLSKEAEDFVYNNSTSINTLTFPSYLDAEVTLSDPDDETQKEQIMTQELRASEITNNSNDFLNRLIDEDPKNLYFEFLKSVRDQKDHDYTGTYVHSHHIIPKYFKKKRIRVFMTGTLIELF